MPNADLLAAQAEQEAKQNGALNAAAHPAATPTTAPPGASPYGLHASMPPEINLPGYNNYLGQMPAATSSASPWDVLKTAGSAALHDGGSFLSGLAALFGG